MDGGGRGIGDREAYLVMCSYWSTWLSFVHGIGMRRLVRGVIPCILKDIQWRVMRVIIERRPDPCSVDLEVNRTIRLLAIQCRGAVVTLHVIPSSFVPLSHSSSTSTSITVLRRGVLRDMVLVVGCWCSGSWRGWFVGGVLGFCFTVGGTFQSKVRNISSWGGVVVVFRECVF